MTTYCGRCADDEDLAQFSLLALKNKRDLHPSFETLDMVTLLCSYMTQGHLLYVADGDRRMIGIAAYYHGTPEEEFNDRDIVFINFVILEKRYRGTRIFLKGLHYLAEQIVEAHPEVQELRFKALSENSYLCKLYSKFAAARYTQEGEAGEETVFCVNIHSLKATLNRYYRV